MKPELSVGTDMEKEAPAAPKKVIWAWNWRASTAAGVGAAETKAARRERAVNMVRDFMMRGDIW